MQVGSEAPVLLGIVEAIQAKELAVTQQLKDFIHIIAQAILGIEGTSLAVAQTNIILGQQALGIEGLAVIAPLDVGIPFLGGIHVSLVGLPVVTDLQGGQTLFAQRRIQASGIHLFSSMHLFLSFWVSRFVCGFPYRAFTISHITCNTQHVFANSAYHLTSCCFALGIVHKKNVKKFLAKKYCLQQMAHSSYHEVMNPIALASSS